MNCVNHLVEQSQNFNFVHKVYLYVLGDSRNRRRASSLVNKSRPLFCSLKAKKCGEKNVKKFKACKQIPRTQLSMIKRHLKILLSALAKLRFEY
jgi:hypothetical protein